MIKGNILLCGSLSGCGKSTVAKYLTDNYGYKEISFAEGIYEIANKYFFMDTKNRKLLQDIGQKLREIDERVWTNYTFTRQELWEYDKIVISDCRQMNELKEGIELKFTPIRVNCDYNKAVSRMMKRDGQCDMKLLETPGEIATRSYNMLDVYNNGTLDDLYKQVDRLMKGE